MGKKKPVQLPFEQNVEYQEWKPSETPDTQALRSMSAMPETLAPVLQAQYDRAQERSAQSWGSAYGANIPDVTRRAMQGQERRGMMADYGAQMGQAAFDANNANFQRRLALAEMTLGRPLQSKSSGFNSQIPQSSGLGAAALQGAASVGGTALLVF